MALLWTCTSRVQAARCRRAKHRRHSSSCSPRHCSHGTTTRRALVEVTQRPCVTVVLGPCGAGLSTTSWAWANSGRRSHFSLVHVSDVSLISNILKNESRSTNKVGYAQDGSNWHVLAPLDAVVQTTERLVTDSTKPQYTVAFSISQSSLCCCLGADGFTSSETDNTTSVAWGIRESSGGSRIWNQGGPKKINLTTNMTCERSK